MTQPTVSIVTAWHNHPELIPAYEAAVRDADQIIIVDNGSDAFTRQHLDAMISRLDPAPDGVRVHLRKKGVLIPLGENFGFGKANNVGINHALMGNSDIIVCLNNDVVARGDWLSQVRRDVLQGALYGNNIAGHSVEGVIVPYVEGWCLAARRELLESLGGFDTTNYEFAYYEDADLSLRACLAGNKLLQTEWKIEHLRHGDRVGNTTSSTTEGAYSFAEKNRATYFERVRRAMREVTK